MVIPRCYLGNGEEYLYKDVITSKGAIFIYILYMHKEFPPSIYVEIYNRQWKNKNKRYIE